VENDYEYDQEDGADSYSYGSEDESSGDEKDRPDFLKKNPNKTVTEGEKKEVMK